MLLSEALEGLIVFARENEHLDSLQEQHEFLEVHCGVDSESREPLKADTKWFFFLHRELPGLKAPK